MTTTAATTYTTKTNSSQDCKSRNIHIAESLGCNQLAKCLTRNDYGLIVYEEYTIAALRQFATQRGLMEAGGEVERMLGRELLSMLEHADKHADLSGFADLPAELRLEVYEWYFASLPKLVGDDRSSRPNHQPPLIRSCGWIRKEAMPIFMRGCKLTVNIGASRAIDNWGPKLKLRHVGGISQTQKECSMFNLCAEGASELYIHLYGWYSNLDVDPPRYYSRGIPTKHPEPAYTFVVPMKDSRPAALDTIKMLPEPEPYQKTNIERLLNDIKEALERVLAKPAGEKIDMDEFGAVQAAIEMHVE